MEYLYYRQKIPQKMTKKDSERNKLYSNVKIQKLDPLSAALDDAGFKGGASKMKLSKSVTRTDNTISTGVPNKNKTTVKQSKYQSDLRRFYDCFVRDPRKN